jgi:hypothetical protein
MTALSAPLQDHLGVMLVIESGNVKNIDLAKFMVSDLARYA